MGLREDDFSLAVVPDQSVKTALCKLRKINMDSRRRLCGFALLAKRDSILVKFRLLWTAH